MMANVFDLAVVEWVFQSIDFASEAHLTVAAEIVATAAAVAVEDFAGGDGPRLYVSLQYCNLATQELSSPHKNYVKAIQRKNI